MVTNLNPLTESDHKRVWNITSNEISYRLAKFHIGFRFYISTVNISMEMPIKCKIICSKELILGNERKCPLCSR